MAMSLHRSLACGSDTTLINSPSTPGADLTKWESVAKHILRGYDNHDIQLLCGFFPFEDTDILYSLLRNRWVPFLNAFVIYIGGGTYSRKFVDALSVDQKIQYIFKSLEIPFSPPESRWEWSWTPHEALNEIASTIAFNIDKDSCSQFAKIPFKDLVKQALGDDVKSLLEFIAQHVRLSIQISRYLREYPHVRSKYIQVEKELETQSPFAHRALSYALQPGLPTPFSEFYKILDFLIKPVQKLFKERNTREALRLLNILAVRHQHAYQRPGEIDWRQDFQTDTEFFDLITSMSLIELADLLNDNDYIEFLQLSPKDTVKNGYTLQLLHRRWNHLCERVKECIIADRNLGLRVRELAQHLYTLSNFYSSLALVSGLRAANYIESSFLFQLSDPENGYAAYLEEFALRGGLPFLIPHFLKHQMNRNKAMAEIFAFATHTRVPPLGRCVMPLSPRTPAEDIEEQRDPPSWTNCGSWILTALTSCFGGL